MSTWVQERLSVGQELFGGRQRRRCGSGEGWLGLGGPGDTIWAYPEKSVEQLSYMVLFAF